MDIQFSINWNNLTTAHGKEIITFYDERHQAVDLVGVELQVGCYKSGEGRVQNLNRLLERPKMAKLVNFK